MKITEDIKYVGVNDLSIDLFEGQYPVKNGISYNSYVILDEKIAVTDTVDRRFLNEWLDNVSAALQERKPDYLIVHHMEPDHSANIAAFIAAYPDVTVAATAKAFSMMEQFFGSRFECKRLTVAEGTVLSLGRHTLTFYTAPMVHWPEVAVSYDSCDKVLFSADAFGKFGIPGTDEPWDDEARRYYIGIVGKYGVQVQ
ncbi:MAG TPA: FprA family A-type flavoprotein, partial [Bacillota bacterium]|nr:FprA family A-type flavoprotein [Bacillota bacterium]